MIKYFTLFLLAGIIAFAGEIKFDNGKISYNSSSDNELRRGTIEFGDYEIPYDLMNVSQNGKMKEYQFGIREEVEDIFEHTNILPGSKGTVIVQGNKITNILFGYTKVGEESDESIPLIINSFSLTEDGIEEIKNGYFDLGGIFKFNVEQNELEGLVETYGKSNKRYYYNKTYKQEYSFSVEPLNLEPTLYLDGELHISPEEFQAKGSLGVSIFRERMRIGNFNFPDFLTKDNPYKVYGEVTFDNVHNILIVKRKREINSGNLTLSGKEKLMVTFDNNFGVRLEINGSIDYDLKDIIPIIKRDDVDLNNISEYTKNFPADERLMIWLLQFYMTENELVELHNAGKNLEKSLKLYLVLGYDPLAVEAGEDYPDFNLIKLDIDAGGAKESKTYKLN
jgi:hypothetical protein